MSELFSSPGYLDALERNGCVGPACGWTAAHLQLGDGSRAPSYRKAHSWGEFVFDFEIARAYMQHGMDYYPKRVCCAPFTPVPGPRLIAADDARRAALAEALIEQTRAEGSSSAHILYPTTDEMALLETGPWLRREQLRFVWRNRGYADFDAFLAALSSRRRKNIRRERRLVADAGFEIGWHTADSLTPEQWQVVDACYSDTYHVRGQQPYLNRACLQDWARQFGPQMQVCLARRDGRPQAMAFFFEDERGLYGRHWGSLTGDELLHFELCYYQGIEYAIDRGLAVFDAGVQGEHKLLRGFEAERACSAHWFVHDGMHAAVQRYFEQERDVLAGRIAACAAHSAYRSAD